MVLFSEANVFSVLTRSLKGSRNKTALMPSAIAINMLCNAAWKRRQGMISAARGFMRLPKDLRINVLEQSVPDRVDDFFMVGSRNEPSFMSWSPLAHFGGQLHHLNYTKILLRRTVLHINSVEDLRLLRRWLATVDFTPMGSDTLNNGFDGVRHLSFTDLLNLSDAHLPFPSGEYNSDGTTPAHYWRFVYWSWEPSTWKPVWADCVALTRQCKDLRTLELPLRLSENLMARLHEQNNMDAVLGTVKSEGAAEVSSGVTRVSEDHFNHPDANQIVRLLDLQGLRVLRVLFYAPWYESDELSEEQLSMISRWLEGRFKSRGQAVEVQGTFAQLEGP
jgi:hypothetical protein